MEYIVSKGFGITTTCCHDQFSPGLKDFLHHKKVPATDKRTRVAHFEQPIFAVKHMTNDGDAKEFTWTIVSFQSIAATNLTGENNLMPLTLYVQPKYGGYKTQQAAMGY